MPDHDNSALQTIPLANFDMLAVAGEDARKFLQGQVTCDLDQVSPSLSLQGAICNVKGRVIADFRLVEHDGTFYLALTTGMAAVVKPVLDKYIVFSRAECQVVTDTVRRTGILGDGAADTVEALVGSCPDADGAVITAGNTLLLKIPGLVPRYELWQLAPAPGQRPPLPESLATPSATAPLERWTLEDIRAGIAHVTPGLSEQHLPEVLNYDLSGVVNFKKGCYTGQEIVARMYYRGTAKRRLYTGVATETGSRPQTIHCRPAAGAAVQDGELIDAVQDDSGSWQVLAILPTILSESALQEQRDDGGSSGNGDDVLVYLDHDEDCTVRVQSLPYGLGTARV